MDIVNLYVVMSVAFLGSLGHCVGMCGGFIVAYTAAKVDSDKSRAYQFLCHFLYNIGRVTSYAIIGAFFGLLGSIFVFDHISMGILNVVIGIFMFFMGLSLMGKIRFLTSIESSLASSPAVKKLFSMLIHSKSLPSFFFLGMLNGFLPCGLVYFFAASAASTGSPFWGAVVMMIFGLSTIPVLLGLGFIVGSLKSTSFRKTMIQIASFLIIVFGLYMIYKGYWFITDPNATFHDCCKAKHP
ncbi:MAG: sulfite exporter TauE/SafE family protein [Epsilonproteobacteria bacterium]|nr:sulfite exporter TauE/SafE family protein [Campylobacterota bacterium]